MNINIAIQDINAVTNSESTTVDEMAKNEMDDKDDMMNVHPDTETDVVMADDNMKKADDGMEMKEGMDEQKGPGKKGKEAMSGEQFQMYQEQKLLKDQLREILDKEGGGGQTVIQNNATLYWERIGNIVLLFIPPIVATGNSSMATAPIQTSTFIPDEIQKPIGSTNNVMPYLYSITGQTDAFTGIVGLRYGACTVSVGALTLSKTLDNSIGFGPADQFLGSEGILVNYLIN